MSPGLKTAFKQLKPDNNGHDLIDGFPNIVADEKVLTQYRGFKKEFYANVSNIPFDKIRSGFGIALHMHQPTIPASRDDVKNAQLIGNLQHMMDHQHVHDNHNAPVFMWCYQRMAEFIPELVAQGKNPRIMLDYSGNLLWGLRQMEEGKALEKLKLVTCDSKYYRHVEWLGTMWSHAVVSSTPVPDIKLHIQAWQQHFASIFGWEALRRVKGFSAPEMHLPIHPDVCYEYVKALKDCGYEWLMVQEHTIQNLDGSGVRRPYLPHKLVTKNSLGQVQEITVLIKTQGSDTKLVAQMQPYYEAKGRNREDYQGKQIPPLAVQIGDGENGGVMMNEFPPAYKLAFREITTEGTVGLNGSEYLEFIHRTGLKDDDFCAVQPVMQNRIWEFLKDFGPDAADRAIDQAKKKYHDFNLDRASWTNNISWIKGYENVLDPIFKLSVEFHKKFDGKSIPKLNRQYREALTFLLLSQTSCFRYWGQGIWTEYAKEICRRGMEALKQ